MRTMMYVPAICQEGGKYEGHLILKVPHARDKIMFLKKLNYKFDSEGKVVASENVTDLLLGMIDIAEESMLECHLTEKESKLALSKEDLFYGADFQELLSEVGRVVVEGMSPSKNSLA